MPGRVLIVAPQIAPESFAVAVDRRCRPRRTAGGRVAGPGRVGERAAHSPGGRRRSADRPDRPRPVARGGPRDDRAREQRRAGAARGEPASPRRPARGGAGSRGRRAGAARRGRSPRALAGFAERLVANGAPAAMLWADVADAARSRKWFAAWRDGLDWPALARLDGTSFEHAGQLAARRCVRHDRCDVPRRGWSGAVAAARRRVADLRHGRAARQLAPPRRRLRRHRARRSPSACSRPSAPRAASTSSSATTAPTSRP